MGASRRKGKGKSQAERGTGDGLILFIQWTMPFFIEKDCYKYIFVI